MEPINKDEVPDYYDFIKFPMDIRSMDKKLQNNEYKDKDSFVDDVKLIFSNTRRYNQPETVYYKAADELESFINPYLNSLRTDKCGFAPDLTETEEKKENIPGIKKKISKSK